MNEIYSIDVYQAQSIGLLLTLTVFTTLMPIKTYTDIRIFEKTIVGSFQSSHLFYIVVS